MPLARNGRRSVARPLYELPRRLLAHGGGGDVTSPDEETASEKRLPHATRAAGAGLRAAQNASA